MNQLSEIIKQFREKKGWNKSQMARQLDISSQLYGQYENNQKTPGADFFVQWKRVFNEDLAETIVSRETSKKNHITTRNNLKEAGELKRGVMVYESAPVQAGIRTVYHDEHQVPDYVLNIPQFRDCNYGTRASGDSMYPEIRNGDLIICKELPLDARIIFGDIYVVHTKDGIETIKYIQQFVDNDNNEPWVLLVPHNKAAGMGTPIPRKEIIKLFKVRAIFKAY